MSKVTYDAESMTLMIDDAGVERALRQLYRKTPDVLRRAINQTARQTRHDLIDEAGNRYALTTRGRARLLKLKLLKSATLTNLAAEIRQNDEGLPMNASYFRHSPVVSRMGQNAFRSPAYQRVQTLKGGPMEDITEGEIKVGDAVKAASKGFLIKVHNNKAGNDHMMFAARVLGSSTSRTTTRTGKPRWTNKAGDVEKAYDVNRIGASSQQRAVWYRGVDNLAAERLERLVEQEIARVIAAAK